MRGGCVLDRIVAKILDPLFGAQLSCPWYLMRLVCMKAAVHSASVMHQGVQLVTICTVTAMAEYSNEAVGALCQNSSKTLDLPFDA